MRKSGGLLLLVCLDGQDRMHVGTKKEGRPSKENRGEAGDSKPSRRGFPGRPGRDCEDTGIRNRWRRRSSLQLSYRSRSDSLAGEVPGW